MNFSIVSSFYDGQSPNFKIASPSHLLKFKLSTLQIIKKNLKFELTNSIITMELSSVDQQSSSSFLSWTIRH